MSRWGSSKRARTDLQAPSTHRAATRVLGARPMIPYGLDAAQALQARALERPPVLFIDSARDFYGRLIRGGPDQWKLASKFIENHGPGSALVLPPGAEIAGFRYPLLPEFGAFDVCLEVWAFGKTAIEQDAIGRSLILAGLESVYVHGGFTDRELRGANHGGRFESA